MTEATMARQFEISAATTSINEQGQVDVDVQSATVRMPGFAPMLAGEAPIDPSVAEFIAEGGNELYVGEGMNSVEADQPTREGWLSNVAAGVGERVGSALDKVTPRTKVGALGASLLALTGGTAVSASAETVNAQPTVTTTTTLEIGIAGSKQKVANSANARVVSNYRTVSQAKIAEAKRKGNCETISGREAMRRGIKTQGYNGSGRGYEYENRRSTLCDIDGDGDIDVRAECGNKAKGGVANVVKAKATTWVKNAAKASVSVKAHAVAKAVAVCKTSNTYAAAYGMGEASSSARAKAKTFNRVKGTLKSLISKASTGANGTASAKASAEAKAVCVETGGTVVSIQEVPVTPVVPGKPGTLTPPPPATAPGANPAPSPQDPTITPANPTGSHQCYSEATGAQVPANPDTTCPVGSFGG